MQGSSKNDKPKTNAEKRTSRRKNRRVSTNCRYKWSDKKDKVLTIRLKVKPDNIKNVEYTQRHLDEMKEMHRALKEYKIKWIKKWLTLSK